MEVEKDGFLKFLMDVPVYAIPEVKDISWHGGNQRHILIVVDHTQGSFLQSAEYELLLKILPAIQLTPQDVAVVNLQEAGKDFFASAVRKIHPQMVLVFGAIFDGMPSLTEYQPVQIGSCKWLWSKSLTLLAANLEEKKRLWAVLKSVFLA